MSYRLDDLPAVGRKKEMAQHLLAWRAAVIYLMYCSHDFLVRQLGLTIPRDTPCASVIYRAAVDQPGTRENDLRPSKGRSAPTLARFSNGIW
jgi:hypothetical protein